MFCLGVGHATIDGGVSGGVGVVVGGGGGHIIIIIGRRVVVGAGVGDGRFAIVVVDGEGRDGALLLAAIVVSRRCRRHRVRPSSSSSSSLLAKYYERECSEAADDRTAIRRLKGEAPWMITNDHGGRRQK